MDTKKSRMKKEQQQYLLNFLMRNPEMVNRNPQLPATKRLWAKLTEALNGMGGVRKTQKDWIETYKLLARRAKAKMRAHRASMQRTGGGLPADICLTYLEKKTINIERTSTIHGLPGAVEADIHSDIEEEPPKEAAMADASTQTASHDGATVVSSMAPVDAPMLPAVDSERASVGCSREHTVASTPEPRLESRVVGNTPRLERRNKLRATPRTLVPPVDSATPQDPMIAALREGVQAQMALANAQTEAARHLGDCIIRAATMFVGAMGLYSKNK